MKKEASLPIRLDSDLNRRLEVLAEKLGFSKSTLIRMLIKSFVEQMESNGGQVTLPLQWTAGARTGAVRLPQVAEAPVVYRAGKRSRKPLP